MNVIPFTEENLAISLQNAYTSINAINQKYHFRYFKDYLGASGLNAKTIVVEDNYISRDFLHDYASYYALCFENYSKFCKRVHFFDITLTEEEFKNKILLSTAESAEFWTHYLGFIVIKPIPVTVIGYTVLKTYDSGNNNERNFWGLREYPIHLFGHRIDIQSLAFQEQDSVLSACATTAIWSMLNKAAIDFHTILKSPNQITKDADNVSPDGSRLFPNKGLNVFQICQAIYNSGLVSEVKPPDSIVADKDGKPVSYVVSIEYLKKILNAYAPIGIPIIFVINVPNGHNNYGLHAVTVSGFKQKAPSHITPRREISWMANNIEKFYAHDDQWGPFTRFELKGSNELETTWTIFDSSKRPSYVTNIIVPIYPKIRISYEDIEVIVLGLDTILTLFLENMIISDLVWDIKIDFSENFKKHIVNSGIDDSEKLRVLSKSLPKYLWIASCYISENRILDFTFDATDVNNGMIAEDFISYLPLELERLLNKFLEANKAIIQSLFKHKIGEDYYDFLLTKLREQSANSQTERTNS